MSLFLVVWPVTTLVFALAWAQAALVPPPAEGWTTKATLTRVLDGDTLEVKVERTLRIRMLDCWAPETRGSERPLGLESKANLESLLNDGVETGDPVRVIIHIPPGRDGRLQDVFTFGRALAHVWKPGAEQSLSELQVEAGHATVTKDR